jgi:hypothetical protein
MLAATAAQTLAFLVLMPPSAPALHRAAPFPFTAPAQLLRVQDGDGDRTAV